MRTVNLCVAGLVAGAGLSVTPSVWASNAKSYPGILCVESGDSDPEIEYGLAWAQNSNTSWDATFSCPIVRDATAAGARITDAEVSVRDWHDGKSVSCRLYAADRFGLGVAWTGTESTSETGIGDTTLHLGGLSIPDSLARGPYVIRCTVPNLSGTISSIGSYWVNEE